MDGRRMRGSLGAGLTLVLAGVVALLAVAVILALRGWPGVREDSRASDPVRLPSSPARDAKPPVVLGEQRRGGSGGRGRDRDGGAGGLVSPH